MKLGKAAELADVRFDMTPMIDCVFQLIIFFMLVTDMSQRELEFVTLPPAYQAVKDEDPEKKRITINVCEWPPGEGKWAIKMGGREISYDELRQVLREYWRASEKTTEQFSERTLMIRADENAKFEVVQNVLRICAEEQFYKIEFGTKIPKEE